MKSPFAKRMQCVTSPIRELVATANALEKNGKKVLYANTGDPLRYDFDPPSSVINGLIKAVKHRHNYYENSQGGLDCRQAISSREKRINKINVNPNNIIITDGVSEALSFLTSILIDSKSEALLPGPSYPPYITRIEFFGGKCRFYKTVEENGWQPSIEDIEKNITDKTKFLLVINPNNPTGAVYDKKTLKEIINLAGQYKLTLVSDEIYDLLTFDAPLVSMSSLAKEIPLIVFNGFSKSMLITGWRLGYCYFMNMDEKHKKIKDYMIKLAQQRLSANTPSQKAVIEGLKSDSHIKSVNKKLKTRAQLSYKRLNEIPGISCVKPKGAFYAFPKIDLEKKWKTDKEFVIDFLNKQHVLLVPGSGFGKYGEGHVRIVILPQENYLNEIYDRLEKFMK